MRIRVLFDNEASARDLCAGWGISLLVGDKILFDTGEKGAWLVHNAKKLGVDFRHLEAVVISHEHWDHTGGLWDVLKIKKGISVYVCPNSSGAFKDKVKGLGGRLIEAEEMTEIAADIFTTGEIPGKYKDAYMPEQSLILKTANGISVLTGCAHPGIIQIIKKIQSHFSVQSNYAVIGGFHLGYESEEFVDLVVDEFKKTGVRKVGPMHCTGDEAKEMFRKAFGGQLMSLAVGQEAYL